MKNYTKHFFVLFTLAFFFACNPNSNTITPSNDWYFEIVVDGVSHKIGGTDDPCPSTTGLNLQQILGPNNFVCASASMSSNAISNINAISSGNNEPDYISGGSFNIALATSTTSPSPVVLGNNNLIIFDGNISSSIGIDAFESTSGISNGLYYASGGYSLTPMDTTSLISSVGIFPINITQLSTPSSLSANGCWNFGDALIGSGQATIYVLDTIDNSSQQPYRYRRPYNIEINFKGYQFQ